MPPVQNAGVLEGTEWATSHHRSVRQGGGKKETADRGRGYAVEHGEGLSGLRQINRYGYLLHIPVAGLDDGRRRLSRSGRQPSEGAEDLGTAGDYSGTRG